jgi:predicted lipoprotein with Yx(FWY)xxD motif
MTASAKQNSPRNSPRRRRRRLLELGLAGGALALVALFAAIALASSALTVDAAANTKLGEKVLVNSQGRTLYVLTPETAGHLLCKSSECLQFWPPLTVPSRSTKLQLGAGVHGRLGILRRSTGMLQVTFDGLPLYRFAEDRSRGEAGGQNFKSFGGTWHVLSDTGVPSAPAPAGTTPATGTTPTTSTPTSTSPGYSSPGW